MASCNLGYVRLNTEEVKWLCFFFLLWFFCLKETEMLSFFLMPLFQASVLYFITPNTKSPGCILAKKLSIEWWQSIYCKCLWNIAKAWPLLRWCCFREQFKLNEVRHCCLVLWCPHKAVLALDSVTQNRFDTFEKAFFRCHSYLNCHSWSNLPSPPQTPRALTEMSAKSETKRGAEKVSFYMKLSGPKITTLIFYQKSSAKSLCGPASRHARQC